MQTFDISAVAERLIDERDTHRDAEDGRLSARYSTTCPGCGRTIYLHGRTASRWTDHSFGGLHVCTLAGA